MIVEVHLTLLEEAENDEHLEACHDTPCEHKAHLVRAVAERYSGVVEVFEFVTESRPEYEKRLHDNITRRLDQAPFVAQRKQEARSLAIIRRGWDHLYGAEEDGESSEHRSRFTACFARKPAQLLPVPASFVTRKTSPRSPTDVPLHVAPWEAVFPDH